MQRYLSDLPKRGLKRSFSRIRSNEYWKQSQVLKELEENFAILNDESGRYSKIRCETLFKSTEEQYQVDVLTFPSKLVFNDSKQFLDVIKFLNDSTILFNFDPSQSLLLDRKIAFMSRQPENSEFNDSYSLKMKYDISEAGYFRNIFSLDFPNEAIFELDLLKKAFDIGWSNMVEEKGVEPGINEKRGEIKKAFLMEKDISYSNQNVNLLFEFLMMNEDSEKYKSKEIGMVGMPELLFRAQMARHMSPASIIDNLIDYYDFVENRIKFLENQSRRHLESEREYVFNDYMRKEDYLIKTSLHYNSLFFRSCYTYKLIQELAKKIPNLVVVVDPLVNKHFSEIVKSSKIKKEIDKKDIKTEEFDTSIFEFQKQFGNVKKVNDEAVSRYFREKIETYYKDQEDKDFVITKAVDPIRSDFEEMNTIRGFNLKRKDKALDLAFKMAAMDVLWDTKLYRSKFCEFDLYYLGEDLFDIPKDLRLKCQKRFIMSYKQISAMKDKIQTRVKECKQVGGFDDLKKDIEESTGMKLDSSQVFTDLDDFDFDMELDYQNEFNEAEVEHVTRDDPDCI